MKFATKRIDNTHLTLGIVTTLPWEIKSQFFEDIQQIWKKMGTNFDIFRV